MARRIEQVDVNVFPIERHTCRVNRDTTVLFFGIVIGSRRAAVHFSNAMLVTGDKQHALGDGGFAGIDVGNDPDVAKVLKFTCHCLNEGTHTK